MITIGELKKLLSRWEDSDKVAFDIKDYYSVYGKGAEVSVSKSGDKEWIGSRYVEGLVRITLHLIEEEGKHPKITFRK